MTGAHDPHGGSPAPDGSDHEGGRQTVPGSGATEARAPGVALPPPPQPAIPSRRAARSSAEASTPSSAPPPSARIEPPRIEQPRIEPPSADLAEVRAESSLPGAHRGGFERELTAPVDVAATAIGPTPDGQPVAEWYFPEPAPRRPVAGWALAFSLGGLVFSFFVGWAFVLGLIGIVTAIVALRRPIESRAVGVWALVLGTVSLVYSAGWLVYAATRGGLFG